MISFNDMDYYENHFVLCALKIILCFVLCALKIILCFVVLCCAKALFKNEMNYLPCCLLFICSICFSNFSTSPLSPFIFALPLARLRVVIYVLQLLFHLGHDFIFACDFFYFIDLIFFNKWKKSNPKKQRLGSSFHWNI